MFRKLLIANRGEIACRVMRTARRLGIPTVAVYSDADARAPHVRLADEAVRIGPAPVAQSYLDIGRIVEACRETGADAVHPGYGFLSERAEFAEALDAAGITFVGPGTRAIEVMGDKIASKRFAIDAEVPTVPGFDGEVKDAAQALEVAAEIGLPVMIKASAGGGGKGMRVAHTIEEVEEGFERARSEAATAFGDERIFIERFVTSPRHIEIQVLADAHGECVHLGERECSLQRRNQKVIEEAPSPFVTEAMRDEMGGRAVALAKAVGYRGAGTVEFIVDGDRNFFFLEMNTRLQVEHPVTELVTGVDLVEQQLRVAAGKKLSLRQADIRLNGWAIEARLYAENPRTGFLPSVGRLTRYRPPSETEADGSSLRVDDGVEEGGEVSIYYDPMLAKLCSHAPTRDEATSALLDALDAYEIEGIETNLGFLSSLLRLERWESGDLTTGLIAEVYPDGYAPRDPDVEEKLDATMLALSAELRTGARRGARFHHADLPVTIVAIVDGEHERLSVDLSEDGLSVRMEGRDEPVRLRYGERRGSIFVDDRKVFGLVAPDGRGWRVSRRGSETGVAFANELLARLLPIMPERATGGDDDELRCPMPGTVVSIHVAEGQRVANGDVLAVIEAMKMENTLRAPRDAEIEKVHVTVGDGLSVDDSIMSFVRAER